MSSKNLVSKIIHSFLVTGYLIINSFKQSALIHLCIHSLQQQGPQMQEILFSKDIRRSTNATLYIKCYYSNDEQELTIINAYG